MQRHTNDWQLNGLWNVSIRLMGENGQSRRLPTKSHALKIAPFARTCHAHWTHCVVARRRHTFHHTSYCGNRWFTIAIANWNAVCRKYWLGRARAYKESRFPAFTPSACIHHRQPHTDGYWLVLEIDCIATNFRQWRWTRETRLEHV